jgi:DNA-binding NtrC family response regulator
MARMLVVDDEIGILATIRTMLEQAGHTVDTSSDPSIAVDLLGKQEYNVMLSDVKMTPIDGMQLLKIAHTKQPKMAVIILTGYATVDTAVESLQSDVFDYLQKPFRVDELLDVVDRALGYNRALVGNVSAEEREAFERDRDTFLKKFLRNKEDKFSDDVPHLL